MKKILTPERLAEAQRRRRAGETTQQIADAMGLSYGSAYNASHAKPPPSPPGQSKTLREMLAIQEARLKIALGNEANDRKISPSTGKIAREVERLRRELTEADAVAAAPPPVDAASVAMLSDLPDDLESLPPLSRKQLEQIASHHIAALQAEIARCDAEHNPAGAMTARRMLTQVLPVAARLTPEDKEADGEFTRVRTAEIAEAATRARTKMSELLERVVSERAGWTRCEHCGQPIALKSAGVQSIA